MMMPIYPGAPWVPKFGGPDSELKYGEWKEQLQGLLEYAGLAEPRKVSILMGALTGLAKRQVQVLAEGDRDTTAKIFSVLDGLYRGRAPIALVRSQFFNCQQNPEEPVQSYILRLRELHRRLQQHDPDEAPTDDHLKEQFLLGLEEGSLLQALRRHARQNPNGTFDALQQEARLLEEDQRGHRTEVTCMAVGGTNSYKSRSQNVDWKQELKQEIMTELKDQLRDWTQELIRELKPRSPPQGAAYQGQPERVYVPAPTSNSWDTDGKPICRRCKKSGHIARFCKNRSVPTPALN
ncbi:uncharacterized protein LOC115366482 [Myripristis murdjan]|uniref:uncharacterized protein LOC115366482 n=1 Tax=Myripristis murdjan TaxID=586833 RepID=UPI001176219A|nr:uncharacterized protein LOC115366482 [Myripristis murdjan]